MLLRRHSMIMLLFAVLSLCGLGIVMLYSASAFSREAVRVNDAAVFLRKQGLFLGIGLFALGVLGVIDYRKWYKVAWIFLAVAVVGLVLCYVPGIGKRVNGASRWITMGGVTLQPSEFAKVALLLFLASWYSMRTIDPKNFWKVFGIPAGVSGVVLGLILFEKDFGTTGVLGVTVMTVFFVSRMPWRYLALIVVFALVAGSFLVLQDPVRKRRVMAFADDNPENNQGAMYQQRQSLIALGSGGLNGLGLGESRQKMYYVPEAHTDFIFSIVGEEMGLCATLSVVGGFILLMLSGGYIAVRASDIGGGILAGGGTVLIGVQAFVNIGVVTQVLPNKGIALPFISYGGSSVMALLMLVGLMLSVARESETRIRVVSLKEATV